LFNAGKFLEKLESRLFLEPELALGEAGKGLIGGWIRRQMITDMAKAGKLLIV